MAVRRGLPDVRGRRPRSSRAGVCRCDTIRPWRPPEVLTPGVRRPSVRPRGVSGDVAQLRRGSSRHRELIMSGGIRVTLPNRIPPPIRGQREEGMGRSTTIRVADPLRGSLENLVSTERSSDIATRERHLGLCRDFVTRHLTHDSILVEVGSADAPFDHLPNLGLRRRVSLDVDIPALGKAERERKMEGGSLIAADGHHMPIREESIDGIVAVFVLERLRYPRRFLREAWRVRPPGGVLFAVTPNVANPMFLPVLLIPVRLRERLLRIVGGHSEHRYLTYLRANTARRLYALASQTGFEVARVAFLWEDHYILKLPAGEMILGALDRWGSGTDLQGFAGRLYVLLKKGDKAAPDHKGGGPS